MVLPVFSLIQALSALEALKSLNGEEGSVYSTPLAGVTLPPGSWTDTQLPRSKLKMQTKRWFLIAPMYRNLLRENSVLSMENQTKVSVMSLSLPPENL